MAKIEPKSELKPKAKIKPEAKVETTPKAKIKPKTKSKSKAKSKPKPKMEEHSFYRETLSLLIDILGSEVILETRQGTTYQGILAAYSPAWQCRCFDEFQWIGAILLRTPPELCSGFGASSLRRLGVEHSRFHLDVGLRCVRIVHTNRPENVSSSDSTGSIEKVTFMHENITGISLLKKIAGCTTDVLVVENLGEVLKLTQCRNANGYSNHTSWPIEFQDV
uniref:Protein kinase domain-containing protein n=1 Tax=Ascaris lumbricoides TaxID=6252 RepID=A0A0M3HF13_ASCLU